MLSRRYFSDLYQASISANKWDQSHFFRFFPQQPESIYFLMEKAGFSAAEYRGSGADLLDGLPSDEWSAKHFVQFLEAEVRTPRRFPIDLNFSCLEMLARKTVYSKWHLASLLRNLIQAQIDYSRDIIKEKEFWGNVLKTLSLVGVPVVFFGDSHSRLFRQTIHGNGGIIIPINVLCGGGSAVGLPNGSSRSGYGSLLNAATKAIGEAEQARKYKVPVCFNFGQVDVEFVHTYRRLKRGDLRPGIAEFYEFCTEVSSSYIAWIRDLAALNTVVVGINPPCINDKYIFEAYLAQMQVYLGAGVADENRGEDFEALVPEFYKLQFSDKLSRTEEHRYFNDCLQKQARQHRVNYIDGFQDLIARSGCIDPKYASAAYEGNVVVGRDGKDIHIGGRSALKMQAKLVKRIVREYFNRSTSGSPF